MRRRRQPGPWALIAALGVASGVQAAVEVVPLAGVPLRSAALLLSGQEGGELPARLACWSVAGAGSPEILCAIEVALPADRTTAQLEVAAYALDQNGEVVATSAHGLRVDPGGDGARTAGVATLVGLVPDGPAAAIRVLVRETGTEELALVVAALSEAPAPMPVAVPEGWAVVSWNIALAADAAHSRELLAALEPARPTALLVVPAESTLRAVVPDDTTSLQLGGTALETREMAALDDGSVLVEVTLPATGPGTAELRLGGEGGSRPVQVVAAGDVAPPWPLLGRQAATAMAAAEPLDAPRHELRRSYAAALAQLGTDRDAAVAAVAALERGVAAIGDPRELARLGRQQAEVVEEALRRDAAAAAAVIQLHRRLYGEYLERREHLVATHAQILLATLLERVARSETVERRTAADLYAAVAGDLQRHRASALAEKLVERAVELDSTHATALLAAGVAHQARGDAPGALQMLDRLLEVAPGDAEARLRRAVCLRQDGRERAAVRELEDLVAGGVEGWVGVVAAQELARFHLAEGEPEGALRVLEAAVRRHPSDRQLRILLAFTLERAGRVQASQRRLAAAAELGSSRGESPRLRFARWPWERLDEIDARLEELARSGAERLGAAMEEGPS